MDSENVEDLFDVVDTIARLVDGPVVVEDVDFRVLAFSAVPGQPNDEARRSAILNRRTPDRWLRWMDESGLREKLLTSDEIVRLDIPWATFLPRYIQPIRAADQLVGFLWVMQGETPLEPDFARTAHEFAALLAPELARRSRALTENPGGQALRQFLGGGLPAPRVAGLLDVDEQTPTVVAAFHVPAATADAVAVRSRAVRALALYTQLHMSGSLVGNVDQQIYLLRCAPSLPGKDLVATLEPAVRHVERALGVDVQAAAGGVHAGLTEAETSRSQADLALRVLRAAPGGPRIGSFDQMRHAIVLHEVLDLMRGRPALAEGIVDPLTEHDHKHGTQYLLTLATYLDSFGDIRSAADQLHIHPNSLRYRLRRLQEIAGLDLTDADLRLALQLVLAAHSPTIRSR